MQIPKNSGFPIFGFFGVGQQVNRGDSEFPRWVSQTLLDRSSKKGKGQQPILVGALFRGHHEHAALKAGGNALVQLKVAQLGVATTSEKYVVAHSAHAQVSFLAVTWEELPDLQDAASDESADLQYRNDRRTWQPPREADEWD